MNLKFLSMKKLTIFLAFLLFVGFQAAAQMQISGTVTGAEDGLSIPGVSVVVKNNPTIGTTTDMDGKYSLTVPSDAETLVFSFIGMRTLELQIAGRSVIDVQLEEEVLEMDEVVVTALGISRERKALGYNVQSVSAEEIAQSNNADVINSLSAKTSGVQINSSAGTAGASTYITIRGASSLTRNNQPLFVVDGVPIITGGGGGAVDGVATSGRSIDLNPEDIEDMTILKGGAATALYGIQAANGAVIVTTKQGQKGKDFQIELSSSVMLSQISQVPGMQDKFAQGYGGNWSPGNSLSFGPRMDTLVYSKDPAVWTTPEYDVYGALVGENTISPSSEYYAGRVEPFNQYDFFQTGVTYNNNLSIRTANEQTKYYFSIGNRAEEGVIPNNTFNRTSIRLNSETQLTDKITTGANMAYINSNGNFIQQGSNTSGVMLGLLRTPPSFDNGAGYKLPDNSQRTYRAGGGYDNPYWTANENFWDDNTNRYMGNAFISYEAADWLSFSYKIGTDFYNRKYKNVLAIYSRTEPDGYVGEFMNRNQIINSDLMANIKKNFGEDLNLNVTIGHNMYQSDYTSVSASATGLDVPGFHDVGNSADDNIGYYKQLVRSAAFFGDLNIGWKNMIYLGATGRYEWSTTMPEDNLAYFYPSVSLGFVFTELPILKDNNILSFGKLRGSYAVTANYADPYATVMTYGQSGAGDGWTGGISFPLGDYNGFANSYTLFSDDLTHELMTTYEVGAEFRFLNDRYGIDVGYFKNTNEDLLMSVPIARSSGYGYKYMNIGVMESYGWEISVNLAPVRTNDFTWDIMANYTQIDNPVKSLAEGVENLFLGGFVDPQIRAVAGQEYRSVYGYDYYRDDNGALVVNDDPTDSYRDGYPMTDGNNMIPLGTVNPDWTANLTNTFTYKGIRLSALLDFKKGGIMYNGTRFTMNYFGTSIETENREVVYNADGSINLDETPEENLVVYDGVLGHIDGDGNVVTAGEDNNIYVVNDAAWYLGQGGNFGGGPTTGAIESTDWIRLREITLGYSFDNKMLESTFLETAEIYFTGKNLWLSTPYRGVDPETSLLGASNGQGMDYFNMPGIKTYTFGLRLGF